MAASGKTRSERLFAAACVRVKTASAGGQAGQLYRDILADLRLRPEEVESFLSEHRAEVEAALAAGRSSAGPS